MRENAIHVGDPIQMRVTSYGMRRRDDMTRRRRVLLVPHLVSDRRRCCPAHHRQSGKLLRDGGRRGPLRCAGPRPKANAGMEQIIEQLRPLDIRVLDYQSSRLTIADEQRKPERQGLFGVLSVGFLAAALLTVLGFFFYALFSFRRRFIELGTLARHRPIPGPDDDLPGLGTGLCHPLGAGRGHALGRAGQQPLHSLSPGRRDPAGDHAALPGRNRLARHHAHLHCFSACCLSSR